MNARFRSTVREAPDEEAAVEALHAAGCTDGLPVILPTPGRVEQMLGLVTEDPDVVLGTVGPGYGEATVEKVAINAVMAGCLPEHFPVVLAAVRAVVEPEFDLDEVQSTTHNLAPLVVVNGPARHECGKIACGYGALGPGHRANAAIGRALRLVLINLGGARPGISDMAVLGHPGKFTYCLGEAEEESPFEPFHVSRGFSPEQSTVTVIGAEAPHSVFAVPSGTPGDTQGVERLLTVLAQALSGFGTNNRIAPRSAATVVLTPVHAGVLAEKGYGRADFQRAIFERTHRKRREILEYAGILGALVPPGDPDETLSIVERPENILVAVAGGAGYYSVVMPGWCGGNHGNLPVTKEIRLNPSCEVPGAV